MQKKNTIFIILLIILILALAVMTILYFDVKNTAKENLEFVLETSEKLSDANKKISELEGKIEEIEDTENETTKQNYEDLEYYVEENTYYTEMAVKEKIALISLEKASNIANEEAKKEIYQFQPWESKFYSTGSAKLISKMSNVDKLSHWNEEWTTNKYSEQLMWQIRLLDENDPLTSLYIYIDAINGDVLGAGSSSD